MKGYEGERPSKGILQTGSKQNVSKGRRISWGEIKVKEFTKNDEVHNRLGEEYNVSLPMVIQEEKLDREDSMMLDDSTVKNSNVNTVDQIKSNNLVNNVNYLNENSKHNNLNSNNLVTNFQTNYGNMNHDIFSSIEYKENNTINNVNTIPNQNSNLFSSVTDTNRNNINNIFSIPLCIIKSDTDKENQISGHTGTGSLINNFGLNPKYINNIFSGLLTTQPEVNKFPHMSNKTIQNPFLTNFNNLPIMNQNEEAFSEDFDLLNTSKKRLTIRGISDIFNTSSSNNKMSLDNLNEPTNINNITMNIKKEFFNDIINKQLNTNEEAKQMENTNKILNNNSSSSSSSIMNNLKICIKPNAGVNTENTENIVNNAFNMNINAKINNPNKIINKTFESDHKNVMLINNNFNNNFSHDVNSNFKMEVDQALRPNNIQSSRLTLNLKDEILKQLKDDKDNNIKSSESDNFDKPQVKKRLTISVEDAIKTLYNDDDYDELDNSFEQRLRERRESNISASPINIKSNKLYYETCLSSASRCIETTEAKNKNEEIKNSNKNNLNVNIKNQHSNNIYNINNQHYEDENDTPKFENEKRKEKSRITINELFPVENKSVFTLTDKSPIMQSTNHNPIINTNKLINPLNTNFSLLKISQDSNDVDKRISDLMNIVNEVNKNKSKVNLELERNINELNMKLNEFNEEQGKIKTNKIQIKEIIENLEKESYALNEKKMVLLFPAKVFGIKVLSSFYETVKIQILNRIILKIQFKEFNGEMLKLNENNPNKHLPIEKINFEIRKRNPELSDKFFDDANCYKIIRNIYEDIINKIINYNEYNKITVSNFHDKLRLIIKYSSSFLYLLEILQTIHSVGLEFNFKFVKENNTILTQFCLLNKLGFKVIFMFEFDVLNSFFGVSYKESNIVNISLSETNFAKCKLKMSSFIEEVKKFLMYKEKLKNPLFLKEFLVKLNENILNL